MSPEINQIKFDNKLLFWAVVESRIKSSEIGVFQNGGLLIVAMKDTVKMEPIVRKKKRYLMKRSKKRIRGKSI